MHRPALPLDRKLIVVAHVDMVGYSRLIALDDAGTLARLEAVRSSVIEPEVTRCRGRIAQVAGDSMLLIFESIDGAVDCSLAIQARTATFDGERPRADEIRFRIGVNLGDVIEHESGLHGDGINVAARLQQECPVGGVCVSRSVHDHLHASLRQRFVRVGVLNLKNIAQPIEAFAYNPESSRLHGRRAAAAHSEGGSSEWRPARAPSGIGRLRALFGSNDAARSPTSAAPSLTPLFTAFERSNDFLAAGDEARLPALLERASQEVWLVGTTFYITVGQYRSLILRKLAEGVSIHILMLQPGGEAIAPMAAQLGVTTEELTLDCMSGIRVLQRTLSDAGRKGHGGRLRIKLLDMPFQTRFYVFDPRALEGWTFFVPQVVGVNSQTIPGFLVANRGAPWLAAYFDVIRQLWDSPNAVDMEAWAARWQPPNPGG